MGDEADGDRSADGRLWIGLSNLDEIIAQLAAKYDLAHDVELARLIDTLFGLSIRDGGAKEHDPDILAERRQKGRALAERMQNAARQMLRELHSLHADMCRFDEIVDSDPTVIEYIFDVSVEGPENLWLPPEIAILDTLFESNDDRAEQVSVDERVGHHSGSSPNDAEFGLSISTADALPVPFKPCRPGFWEEVDDRLSAVVAMPVRDGTPRGKVANVVLRKALLLIRAFWVDHVRRPWTMNRLRNTKDRHELIDSEDLVSLAERFAVDALKAGDIHFTFQDLASAWTALDKARGRASPRP